MTTRSTSARNIISIGLTSALLAACGGGGSGGSDSPPAPSPTPTPDTQAPTAKINFPSEQSLTTADRITVTGNATDPEGNAIASVTVNGVAATSTNDFATWTASVPLSAGDNALVVETADDQDNTGPDAASVTIKNEVALLNPNDIVLDSANGRALLVDSALQALIGVDLDTGQRTVISGDGTGNGNAFIEPNSVVLDTTTANRAFVSDGSELIAVDTQSGDRTLFADTSSAGGLDALDSTLDETNSRLLVIEPSSVIAVPLGSGTPTVFSATGTGAGPDLVAPVGIVIEGTRALVVDAAITGASLVSIDLASGDRTVLSSADVGSGPALQTPLAVTISNDGINALVVDLGNDTVLPGIISVNLATGARNLVSAGGTTPTGAGADFNFPVAIASDGEANRSLVVDPALASVLSVADTNGNRETLSSAGVGDGEPFNGPFNIEYDQANGRALVTDNVTQAIYSVNLDTGARGIVSGAGVGTGTAFDFPLNLAIDGTRAFVTDSDTGSVLSVNLGNGNRTLVTNDFGDNSPVGISLDSSSDTLYLSVIQSDAGGVLSGSELYSLPTGGTTATVLVTSGTALQFAQGLAVDSSSGTAYVADTVADQLLAVTLAGGATANVGAITGTAPTGVAPFQDLALFGSQTAVVDSSLTSVFAFDNTTGTKTTISDDSNGAGVGLQGPTGITYAADRNVLLVVDRLSFAVFAVEPESGDRVIISR